MTNAFLCCVLAIGPKGIAAHAYPQGPKLNPKSKPPTISFQGKKFKFDVNALMEKRLRGHKRGDAVTNEMLFVKKNAILGASVLDFVAVGRNRALAVVAYTNHAMSNRTDINHDLVLLTLTDRVGVKFVRSIRIPERGNFPRYGRRFFVSKGEVVLRVPGGFEILDDNGRAIEPLRAPGVEDLGGFNARGELIGVDEKDCRLVLYDLARRKSRYLTVTFKEPVEPAIDRKPGPHEFEMNVSSPNGRWFRYVIDADSQKIRRIR